MHRILWLVLFIWGPEAAAETSWLYKISVLRFGKETLVTPDNGVVDLRTLQAREYFHVNGEVLFFPGEFLAPRHYTAADIAQLIAEKKPLKVKLNMKIGPYSMDATSASFGTFLLPVRNNEAKDLALAVPRFYHPMTLYLATASEQRTLLSVGPPHQDPSANASFGFAAAPIPTFHATGDFTLVAHVSSPMMNGRNLLNLSSFYVGDAHYLLDVLYESRFIVKAISGSFATIFIFYFCMFLFRPTDKSSLYLGLYALFSFPVSLFYIFDLGLSPQQFLQTGTIFFLLGLAALLFFSMEKIAFLYPPRVHRLAQITIVTLWASTCIALQAMALKLLALLFVASFLIGSIVILLTLYSGLKHRLAGMIFFVGGGVLCMLFLLPMVVAFPTHDTYEYGCNMLLANLSMALAFALMNAKEFAVTYHQSLRQSRNLELLLMEKTRLTEEVESRNAEINQINSNLELIVEDRTRSIQAILRNIRQGILTVSDQNLAIDEQYSLYLHEITKQTKISGESLESLLLARSHLEPDVMAICCTILKSVIGQHVLEFELNQGHLPRDLALDFDGRQRFCELDWDPICDDRGQVQKILMAMRDVTELRLQKFANDKLDAEIATLIAIVKAGKRSFLNFILSSRMKIAQCQQLSLDSAEQQDRYQHIMINLHTLKGNGRSLGLSGYASEIHKAEQQMESLKRQQNFDDAAVHRVLAEVGVEHDKIEMMAAQKLSWKIEDQQQVEINRPDYLQFLALVERYARQRPDFQPVKDMVQMFTAQTFPLLRQALVELTQEAESIARRLDKDAPRIEVKVPDRPLHDEGYRLLQTIIPHLLANSIDHGIESPEARLKDGKPRAGCITMEYEIHGPQAILHYHDDGQGLDLYRIAVKAGRPDLWPCPTPEAQNQLAEFIFQSGVSTKDVATELSGRGVGVSAVRELLAQRGGSIRIVIPKEGQAVTSQHVPFLFEITLPPDIFVFAPDF